MLRCLCIREKEENVMLVNLQGGKDTHAERVKKKSCVKARGNIACKRDLYSEE